MSFGSGCVKTGGEESIPLGPFVPHKDGLFLSIRLSMPFSGRTTGYFKLGTFIRKDNVQLTFVKRNSGQ